MKELKILTVCLGNICRSPAAQGILETVAKRYPHIAFEFDSAGTGAYHVGDAPDSRSIKAMSEIGIDISKQRARKVTLEDFEYYDWILAMDAENLANLKRIQPAGSKAKLVMFGEYSPEVSFGAVQDPYYGQDDGFARMREHLLSMAESFIEYATSSSEGKAQ